MNTLGTNVPDVATNIPHVVVVFYINIGFVPISGIAGLANMVVLKLGVLWCNIGYFCGNQPDIVLV
jgi:hypothetical protein